ncbi:hypothetical protein FBX98_10182 [Burkholderia sp. SJZ115]|nr:hypothetical protein FB600_10182 [Burkholderia sp. SJZ089]TWD08718.1 hypothetical protein FBX98_10182 [Burkholderia sp. SJZ115]TWD11853.1 hypothetical protein FB601_10183 [Burkholderia sp. SJZ091]
MTRGTAGEARLARTWPRAVNRCVATRTAATRSRMRPPRPPFQPSKPRQAAFDNGFRQRLSTRLHARQYRHEKNWAGTRTGIAKLGLDPGSAMAFVAERGRRLTGAQGAVIDRADQAMYATKHQRKDDDGSR